MFESVDGCTDLGTHARTMAGVPSYHHLNRKSIIRNNTQYTKDMKKRNTMIKMFKSSQFYCHT